MLSHPVGDLEEPARRLTITPARTSDSQPVRADHLELIASQSSHSSISSFRSARSAELLFLFIDTATLTAVRTPFYFAFDRISHTAKERLLATTLDVEDLSPLPSEL